MGAESGSNQARVSVPRTRGKSGIIRKLHNKKLWVKVHIFFSAKNSKICLFCSISQKPFIVDSSGKNHKYGPCSGLRTVKTACVYLKRGILEKIFLTWGLKMVKNSTLRKKSRVFFIFQEKMFPPTWPYAPMYDTCDGIPQSIIGHWENASRALRTNGGSVKKCKILTLSLNCAETVRLSEKISVAKNMRSSISFATVKTASLHLKR